VQQNKFLHIHMDINTNDINYVKLLASETKTIDASDPFWIGLCAHVKKTGHRGLEPFNWYMYAEFFTRDQLVQFAELYPEAIKKYQHYVISCLLDSKSTIKDKIQKLKTLHELWNYDYSKADHIKSCLRLKISDRSIYKYFLDCGLNFNQGHLKYAGEISVDILDFMVENGLELNNVATAVVTALNKQNVVLMQKLRHLAEHGIDLTGQLLELPKSSSQPINLANIEFLSDDDDE
jgi:hypothetical protein